MFLSLSARLLPDPNFRCLIVGRVIGISFFTRGYNHMLFSNHLSLYTYCPCAVLWTCVTSGRPVDRSSAIAASVVSEGLIIRAHTSAHHWRLLAVKRRGT